MAAINICVCDCSAGYKTTRFPVEANKLDGKTNSLFSEISKKIGSSEHDFDVVYCGQKMEKDMGLDVFNLSPQSTLFVFVKKQSAQASKGKQDVPITSETMRLIEKAVQRPNYRKTVDQILTRPDSLQKLLNAVPGLDKEPTTMSMLQDPEMLQILASRSNIHRVAKQHPLFAAAAVYVARVVDEEHAKDPNKQARTNVYSMDQMSDEEDDGSQRGAAGGTPQQQITASQLAAALAAATGSAPRPSTSASSSSQATPGRSSGSTTSVISPDFFQQAMRTAQSSALEAQLQHMRDMGITDESLARRALTATQGDLQAALDLIFADNI